MYTLGSTSSSPPTIIFKTQTIASGSFYQLTSTATFQWANDVFSYPCNCKMQYVRVYTDYFPSQQDQFVSLALMNTSSNCIILFDLTTYQKFILPLLGTLYTFHFQIKNESYYNEIQASSVSNTSTHHYSGLLGNASALLVV